MLHSILRIRRTEKTPPRHVDCILGDVVVPRYPFMVQESEEPISVLADSLLIYRGRLRAKVLSHYPVLKSSGWLDEFVEVPTLQSEFVDVINDGLEQIGESPGDSRADSIMLGRRRWSESAQRRI